ncbi:hypothetical protein [Hydrogenophaga sp.]|uniref:hypothetical protein n=1 Tax=Hydrogenophaga sp. TaxID=1904254 RepID=UPI00272F87BA|nr:hypothetical protein [Hydrogenophaga sp.]MDP1686894.1 hypothetical protein [Hydrogenophaga sp.]
MSNSNFDQMSDPRRKRITFDPTINAGHILTSVIFVSGLFIGWTALDKRVVALEEGRKTQEQVDRHQDVMQGQNMTQIRESLVEIKRSVERVSDKLEKRP